MTNTQYFSVFLEKVKICEFISIKETAEGLLILRGGTQGLLAFPFMALSGVKPSSNPSWPWIASVLAYNVNQMALGSPHAFLDPGVALCFTVAVSLLGADVIITEP